MSDKSEKLNEKLKIHGDAIHKSMKKLAEAIKRDPVIKSLGQIKTKI